MYMYMYMHNLSKTSLYQVLKPFIADKIKLLKTLQNFISTFRGDCPFVKNEKYKIEDASYMHSVNYKQKFKNAILKRSP